MPIRGQILSKLSQSRKIAPNLARYCRNFPIAPNFPKFSSITKSRQIWPNLSNFRQIGPNIANLGTSRYILPDLDKLRRILTNRARSCQVAPNTPNSWETWSHSGRALGALSILFEYSQFQPNRADDRQFSPILKSSRDESRQIYRNIAENW